MFQAPRVRDFRLLWTGGTISALDLVANFTDHTLTVITTETP